MSLIDTHCHFDFEAFDADRGQLWQQLAASGVDKLIVPATTAEHWSRLESVVRQYPNIYCAYGLHPMFIAQHQPEHLKQLASWLLKERVVAVGECGLDFYLPDLDQDKQLLLFVEQLKLAKDFDLPVIIHARKSLDVVMKHLRRFTGLRGVIHSFSGSEQQAEKLGELGFCLGVGGTVTYERAQRLRKVLSIVPEEMLLLETDAPDQPDSEWRGRRNEPGRLPAIAEQLAVLRGTTMAHISQVTRANAERLFKL